MTHTELTSDNVDDWLGDRRRAKLPHPPLLDMKRAGVYILAKFDDYGVIDQAVMQWSPAEYDWVEPWSLATNQPHRTMEGYRTISKLDVHIPALPLVILRNDKDRAY